MIYKIISYNEATKVLKVKDRYGNIKELDGNEWWTILSFKANELNPLPPEDLDIYGL